MLTLHCRDESRPDEKKIVASAMGTGLTMSCIRAVNLCTLRSGVGAVAIMETARWINLQRLGTERGSHLSQILPCDESDMQQDRASGWIRSYPDYLRLGNRRQLVPSNTAGILSFHFLASGSSLF